MKSVLLLVAIVFFQSDLSAQEISERTEWATSNVMNSVEVLEFLMLSDEQKDDIAQLLSNARKNFDEKIRTLSSGKRAIELKIVTDSRVDFNDEVGKAMESILLPFQITRLRQFSVQSEINRIGGFNRFLQQTKVRKLLGIDADKSLFLDEASGVLQKEFDVELVKLKSKYRKKLIDELDKEQKSTIHALLGDDEIMSIVSDNQRF